jgi:hypothetical protein
MTTPKHLYCHIRDEIHAGPLEEKPGKTEEKNRREDEGEA